MNQTVRFTDATVIDGGNSARYTADVVIEGDRITQVLPHNKSFAKTDRSEPREAGQTIDARGLVLAPGFIDAHTHDDLALIRNPSMLMKVSQGVTTVITGNCGISLAPMTGMGKHRELVPPFDLIGDASDYCFDRLADYAEGLDEQPAAVNSAMLTGHSTLRREAMDALDRPADAKEAKKMRDRLAQSLADGSVGMSSGLA